MLSSSSSSSSSSSDSGEGEGGAAGGGGGGGGTERRRGMTGYKPTKGLKTHDEALIADQQRQVEDMVSLGRRKGPEAANKQDKQGGAPARPSLSRSRSGTLKVSQLDEMHAAAEQHAAAEAAAAAETSARCAAGEAGGGGAPDRAERLAAPEAPDRKRGRAVWPML